MLKLFFLVTFFVLLFPTQVFAVGPAFVTVVNPVRGEEFWDLKDENPQSAVLGQSKILQGLNIPATWLIRFDALGDREISSSLPSSDEKGILLEITPKLAEAAKVKYRQSEAWHLPGSVFLTGYEVAEREKLIDTAFGKFKAVFGLYPKSAGGWWIDGHSLGYMQKKYGITSSLIVADQYATDNYQIWGQYFGTPYYPSMINALRPARTIDEKVPVVLIQWAARDPVNGYGKYVENSTYSVQVNDYQDFHLLTEDYFSRLIDIYTKQDLNQFGQVVVGLENSYSWEKYKEGYSNQMKVLDSKRRSGQLSFLTMEGFAKWYGSKFTKLSPEHLIVAKDPLGGKGMSVWFMNPYYRAGWFYNSEGSVIRDVRQYVEGDSEPCLKVACDKLQFATFSTRVLDDVTYGKSALLDKGKISDITFKKEGEKFVLTYDNEGGNRKNLEFLPRDISINGSTSSIDTFILKTINSPDSARGSQTGIRAGGNINTPQFADLILETVKFIVFIAIVFFIPGFIVVRSLRQQSLALKIFISIVSGMVIFTLSGYVGGILKAPWLNYFYIAAALVFFILKKYYRELKFSKESLHLDSISVALTLSIVAGAIFQSLALIRSGWVYDFGVGFWGPLGHDGIWHQALIGQLIKQVPPQNPVFSGDVLTNYHYFFDLLVAETTRLSQVPVMDLLYRFYPLTFSILLGVGTYLLVMKLSGSKIAALVSLYFVYFAGSFGWVVEFLRERHFGGESAFWVNQPVSMNLNPPFAISLLIVVVVLLILGSLDKIRVLPGLLVIILIGALIEFKVYGGIIVLSAFFLISLIEIFKRKNLSYFIVFVFSATLAAVIFLPQNKGAGELLVLSPFWFVNSMVDFPDRVGWLRLSSAREAYFARGEWFKFLGVQTLALGIFVIGNLGLRFIGIFSIVSGIKAKLGKDILFTGIILMAAVSLLIPLIFIQMGNPWNTIQFMYYSLYFIALFSGVALINVLKRLPKGLGWFVAAAILLITPINAVVTFRSALYPFPPSRLTLPELDALSALEKLPDGTVLTLPYDKSMRAKLSDPFPLFAYETTGYVSAFSGKETFIEDEVQNEILQTDFRKRLDPARDFFKAPEVSFFRKWGIRYIYLLKAKNTGIDPVNLNLEKIFENSEVLIYEFKG